MLPGWPNYGEFYLPATENILKYRRLKILKITEEGATEKISRKQRGPE